MATSLILIASVSCTNHVPSPSLAKNLYYKDVRFIFELLQNADDNSFERAKANGQEPYIAFGVYDDQIIVDCNEDGFDERNLRAICSVGKSSKLGRQGYIGEKGIGFKSVFKVAWKVHIKSGAFSFCFKHRPGDSGMGMISPEWQPTNDTPEGITRMIFTLHDQGDQTIRLAQRKKHHQRVRATPADNDAVSQKPQASRDKHVSQRWWRSEVFRDDSL